MAANYGKDKLVFWYCLLTVLRQLLSMLANEFHYLGSLVLQIIS